MEMFLRTSRCRERIRRRDHPGRLHFVPGGNAECWGIRAFSASPSSKRQPASFWSIRWETAEFESVVCLWAGWLLWRAAGSRRGYGARLLAGAFFLIGLHGMDRPLWPQHPLYLLRVTFDHLLCVTLGIALMVLVLEGAHSRTEQLNDKLRRLTLLTAASTQTRSVSELLYRGLGHLVESLGAT